MAIPFLSDLVENGDLEAGKNLTEGAVQEFLGKQEKAVLVDFFAPWCGPCKMIAPILEQLVEEEQSRIIVVKVNVEEARELTNACRVFSVPTVICFAKGKDIARHVGFATKQQILNLLPKQV